MYFVILLTLLLLPSVLYVVKGKTAVILETFGRPHKSAVFTGLRAKWPWPITTIVARVNLQLQEIHADVSVKKPMIMLLLVHEEYHPHLWWR